MSGFHWWYIVIGLIFVVIVGAVGFKLVQRTESNIYEKGSQPVSPQTRNNGLLVFQPGCVNVKAEEMKRIMKASINDAKT